MVNINMHIPDSQNRILKVAAMKNGSSKLAIIRGLISDYCDSQSEETKRLALLDD